jgi:predicted nucleic acid-binding protein
MTRRSIDRALALSRASATWRDDGSRPAAGRAQRHGHDRALPRADSRNSRLEAWVDDRCRPLQIAATAARHGLTLLTRNGGVFTGLESALTLVDLPGQP